MAFELQVFIIDGGDRTIKVGHTFYGYSEQEVETYKREHLANCDYFRSAEQEGRLIEVLEVVDDDELPDESDFSEEDDEG